jgi:hypothetical protein
MRFHSVAVGAICLAVLGFGAARAEPGDAQAARLAELRPDSVTISRGRSKVAITGSDLGRFDAQLSPVQNLHKLIEHLGLLHDAARSAEFTVAEQMPRFVRFTQLIGGIPVTQRIEVDLDPDGRITEARLSVVDPALAPKGQPITRARAMQIASLACATQSGATGAEVELEDYPGLHYKPAALGEPLKLQYGFTARAGEAPSVIVTVDAFTGAVGVSSAAIP